MLDFVMGFCIGSMNLVLLTVRPNLHGDFRKCRCSPREANLHLHKSSVDAFLIIDVVFAPATWMG